MAQWVQHKSGIGDKWEVITNLMAIDWTVKAKVNGVVHRLPKSEYVLCEPPKQERWVDITEECEIPNFTDRQHCEVWHQGKRLFIVGNELVIGYRLRKVELLRAVPGLPQPVNQWAFIVEKNVQP